MIKCEGYKSWTDCGYEYDCRYEPEHSCEDCICCNGKYDPRTNKKATIILRITNFIQQTLSKIKTSDSVKH